MNWEGKTILPEDSTEGKYWSLPASVGMEPQISFLGKEKLCSPGRSLSSAAVDC